ncbi:MAG TPA: hypothetical protein VGB44_04755 [Flavobacterium sp.]|jgi:hypothetical protein
MDQEKYLKDIHDIKSLMNRSSQFMSLSGLAGVLAGVYALVGAFVSMRIIDGSRNADGSSTVTLESDPFKAILLVAALVFILALATAVILTYRKANRDGETFWNSTSKRLLINFFIPLVTGGIFTILLLRKEVYGLIAPVMLIFYGLACINASKYTLRDVRYLGLTIIILGLISTEFAGNGLEFWALGFGVCHIIYGGIMYFKYDRK